MSEPSFWMTTSLSISPTACIKVSIPRNGADRFRWCTDLPPRPCHHGSHGHRFAFRGIVGPIFQVANIDLAHERIGFAHTGEAPDTHEPKECAQRDTPPGQERNDENYRDQAGEEDEFPVTSHQEN